MLRKADVVEPSEAERAAYLAWRDRDSQAQEAGEAHDAAELACVAIADAPVDELHVNSNDEIIFTLHFSPTFLINLTFLSKLVLCL